jgi:HNH endonuclease
MGVAGPRPFETAEELYALSTVTPEGCIEFRGRTGRSAADYCVIERNGQRIPAHRFVFELEVGSIPDNTLIHHRCGNTRCINAKHLWPIDPGTHNYVHKACKEHNEWKTLKNGGRACRACERERIRDWKRMKRLTDPAFVEKERTDARERWRRRKA